MIVKRTGNLLLGITLYSFVSLQCEATVYYSNGSAADVQALHSVAFDGDTITLPTGTFTWTRGVTLTKAITVTGQGVGSTVIRDAVQHSRLILWDYSALSNARPRLTGIEFQDGGRRSGGQAPGGVIHITGNSENGARFRMDNCKWVDLNGVLVTTDVLGIIDHCEFDNGIRAGPQIVVYNEHFAGGTYSNGSWSAPSYFGTDKFLFFEDDYFYNPNRNISSIADGYKGARYVVRHCTLYHKQVHTHGTDTGSYPSRGSRAFEIYNNTITGVASINDVAFIRSGVWLIHDNTITGFGSPYFNLSCYRLWSDFADQTFRGADGASAFDVNAGGGPFYAGTAASNTNSLTVRVTGANFATDQWRGYQIVRTSNMDNLPGPYFSEVQHNTVNTITYNPGYSRDLAFSAGDTFEIRRVLHALDQPGRSGGTFVRGNPPVAHNPNDQSTEACYEWNNGNLHFSAVDPVIRANEHYFNSTQMPGYVSYVYPHPLVTLQGRAMVGDFNADGNPDLVLQRPRTHQTAIWYLDNNVPVGAAFGVPIVAGWALAGLADFNQDTHPDYALFNSATQATAIWYLSGPNYVGGGYGPTLPHGWDVAAVADFNGDSHPDYVLYKLSTRQTAIAVLR